LLSIFNFCFKTVHTSIIMRRTHIILCPVHMIRENVQKYVIGFKNNYLNKISKYYCFSEIFIFLIIYLFPGTRHFYVFLAPCARKNIRDRKMRKSADWLFNSRILYLARRYHGIAPLLLVSRCVYLARDTTVPLDIIRKIIL